MLRNLLSFLIERRLLGGRRRLLWFALIVSASSWGCNLNHPGEAPSKGEVYYPIAITLPPVQTDEADSGVPPRYLFVVNANFDLRYNAGSVQAFDLDDLVGEINSCNEYENKCRDSIECKGECDDDAKCLKACDDEYKNFDDCDPYDPCFITPADVLADEALIGSFAATATFSPTGKRLYIPTRSNTALTYVDVDLEAEGDAVLSCGQGSGRKCSDDYIRGDESIATNKEVETTRELKITGESVGAVAARLTTLTDPQGVLETEVVKGYDGVFVAQRNGSVAFFASRDESDRDYDEGPELVHIIENLQTDITNIGLDPVSGRAYVTSQEFGTTGGRKSLQRIGFVYDFDATTSFIYDAGIVYLRGVDLERDTRAIAFSPLAEDKAFIVSRTPNALLIVDFAAARRGALEAFVSRTVKVGTGASRLALGQIGNDPRLFAFVSCFGSRELYVIDVNLAEPVAVIQGFSGPFEVAVDRWRKLAYVADFRSSIVRIVDLRPIVCVPESSDVECPDNPVDAEDPIPCECFDRPSRIVATMGDPRPPEELI